MIDSLAVERCPQCKNERQVDSSPCPICGADAPAAWAAPLPEYTFSGKCPPLGLLLLVAVTLLAGCGVGFGYHMVAHLADYPVISPMIAGMIAGTLVFATMKAAHCRNRKLILALAFLAGMTSYGARVVADSQELRPLMVRSLTHYLVREGVPLASAQTMVERKLTPWHTLRLFLKVQSKEGVTITDSNSSSYSVDTGHGSKTVGGTQLTGVLYWLLSLAELIAAGFGGICLALLLVRALEPYCERDSRWMKGKRLLRLSLRQATSVVEVVKAGDWNKLGQMTPQGGIDDKNKVDVMLYECPVCHSGSIAVQVITANQPKVPVHAILDSDTVSRLSPPNGGRL